MKIGTLVPYLASVDSRTPRRRRCYLVQNGDIRHFGDDGLLLDPSNVRLSDKGIRQVRELCMMMQYVAFDRAVCSDYSCARQTAGILLDEPEDMLEQIEALRDVSAGRLGDVLPKDRSARDRRAYETMGEDDGRFLGGERWDVFEDRVLEHFNLLISEPTWSSLLIVSHNAVNRVLLAWAMGADRRIARSLEQDSGCLNIIDLDMSVLRYWGDW